MEQIIKQKKVTHPIPEAFFAQEKESMNVLRSCSNFDSS